MARSEDEPTGYAYWCGEHNRDGGIQYRVTEDNDGAAGQTKNATSLPSAAAACAATPIESWHFTMPPMPRASTHPHSHFPTFSASSTSSLQPAPTSAGDFFDSKAPLASLDPSLVTIDPGPLLRDHSLQVTNFQEPTTSTFPSPTPRQSPALAPSDAYVSPDDYKVSHHHSASPTLATCTKMSTQENLNLSAEYAEYAEYLNNQEKKVFQQFITHPDDSSNAAPDAGPAADSEYPDMMAYAPAPEINAMALTAYDTAGHDNLPTEQELRTAQFNAKAIYGQYHTVNGVVTGDQKHFDAIQPIDVENLPKSVTLHGAPDKHTYFPDALTAEFYRFACRPNISEDDETIPTSLEAQQSHVRVLVLAFNNAIGCQDNEAMVKPFLDRRHDQKLIECLCWQILQCIIWRAQSPDPLMTAYDLSKARDNNGLESFAERFDAVVKAMCVSKTICKHLNDAPYRMVFIDDPVKAKLRVESNRTLNKLKADQMLIGKQAQEEEARKNGQPVPNNKRKRNNLPVVAAVNNGANRPMDRTSPRSPMAPPQQPPRTPPSQIVRHSARQAGKSPVNYNLDANPQVTSSYASPRDESVGSPVREHFSAGQTKQERLRPALPSPNPLSNPFGVVDGNNYGHTRPSYPTSAYNGVASRRSMGPAPPGSSVPIQPEAMIRRARPQGWNQVCCLLLEIFLY